MNLRERLIGLVAGDCHIHAILLAGTADGGQYALAERLAAAYCFGTDDVSRLDGYPDCIRIGDGGPIKIDAVRAVTGALGAQAFYHGRRAVLIRDAHRMNEPTQNAFLKTLEEPPANTLIVMSGSEAGLLPTIRSRCMIARLGAESRETIAARLVRGGVSEETAVLAARWADGAAERAVRYAGKDYAAFRAEAGGLLWQAIAGDPPFAGVQTLILAEKEQAAPRAAELLTVWLSLLSDALRLQNGLSDAFLQNPEQQTLTAALSSRFTSARLFCIIDILAETEKRLSFRTAPTQTLDAALVRIRQTGEEV